MVQLDTSGAKDHFLATFEQRGLEPERNGRSWLNPLRRSAMDQFAKLGLPTSRDEQWRQTNVASIARTAFEPAATVELNAQQTEQLKEFDCNQIACDRLVFINGLYSAAHSVIQKLPAGVILTNLAEALQTDGERVREHLAQYAKIDNHSFVALNTAFVEDGAYLYLPRGVVIEEPIVIIYLSVGSDKPTASFPRNLIIAEEQSQATIIESYVALDESVYFTNAVTEVVLGAGAVVDHYKIQEESEAAYHISMLQIQQAGTSNFTNHAMTFGAALSRNEIHAVLNGEGIECQLNGLYVAHDHQHMDTHTKLEHAKPHCHSHELYKGILTDHSSGVFNGWILVQQDAQKTDAIQSNRALLLSDSATINTQPQLEIYADDVKCTHGATIGQVSEESVFYLRSRGIGETQARSILTVAFAQEIIDEIKVDPVRAQLERLLWKRLNHDGNEEVS